MSYLEHESNLEHCGCPSCSLMEEYNKVYKKYKTRKAYRAIDGDKEANSIELSLNQMQGRGYEMTAVIGNLIILRSMPPVPPTNSDVVNEFLARKERVEKRSDIKNFNIDDVDEDFGPTVGSA